MILDGAYLTYCTNIHPGKSWADTRRNIISHCPGVKAALSPQRDFGLGVWISAETATDLKAVQYDFKKHLARMGMFVFSINAFPYGDFHGRPVKQRVYTPDWSTPERLDYTKDVCEILAVLLPEGAAGSVSTLPVSYGKRYPEGAVENLLAMAAHLERIEKDTGHHIALALEPEPDCFLENTEECRRFFQSLESHNIGLTRRYLGVCVDTCHMALQFEDPRQALQKLTAANIRVPKIQLSSALKLVNPGPAALQRLRGYDDSVYLHQTRVRQNASMPLKYPDLAQALSSTPMGEWRIHFHVPLHFSGRTSEFCTTSDLLDGKFFETAMAVCEHFEIETYTFDVMPEKKEDVQTSIRKEFEFVLRNMGRPLPGIPGVPH